MSNFSEGHRGTSQFIDRRVQSDELGVQNVVKRRPSSHTKGAELISTKPVRRESEGPRPIYDAKNHIAEGLEARGALEELPESPYFDPAIGE